MKIYFVDNNFNIMLSSSTETNSTYKIVDDLVTYNYETGTSMLNFTVKADTIHTINDLKSINCETFILKENYNVSGSFDLFSALSLTFDLASGTLEVYAENAGLDLLNTRVNKYENSVSKSILQYATYFLPEGWTAVSDNISDSTTRLINWDGESSLTERLLSIANYFDAIMYFNFSVNNLSVTEKTVHFKKKFSNIHNKNYVLTYGKEISNITITKDRTNLATCLIPTGGTPEAVVDGKTSPPIDLKGYSYTYTDEKGDTYQTDTTTGKLMNITQIPKYKNKVDSDGILERAYSFDTLNQNVLAGQARAELQKLSYPEITYKIDIDYVTEDLKVGDLVIINVPRYNLNLKALVIKITQSFTNKSIKAEIEVIE